MTWYFERIGDNAYRCNILLPSGDMVTQSCYDSTEEQAREYFGKLVEDLEKKGQN